MPVTMECAGAGAEEEMTPRYLSWSGKILVGLVDLAGFPLDKRTPKP